MRLFGGAFSGYARGRFLTMPYRALLASALAPPPCSRKSRYAAIFREIFGFIFYNNLSRKQNDAFALAHLHLRASAFAGKVNAARVIWRALKKRAAEENSDCTEHSEGNGVILKSRLFVS